MIPTTPPAKRKTAVKSKKGVETIVEHAEPTAVKITPKPSDKVLRKAAKENTSYQLRDSKRPMIPTTPPAKRKTAVKSKKGVETIVEQAEVTAVKMTEKPDERVDSKSARVGVAGGCTERSCKGIIENTSH